MKRLRTTGLLAMAAAFLLVGACKSIETRNDSPSAPVVKSVKLMVPGAD